jgi:hypothetical protein
MKHRYSVQRGLEKIKTKTNLFISTLTIGFAGIAMMVAVPAITHADSNVQNFESPTYTIGSINGQDGWTATGSAGTGCAVYDEGVVANTYGYPSFGGQSFRLSDAVTSGCFGDQAFAKPLVNSVGETASTAGTYSAGVKQPHFEMQFDIASTQATQQPGMHMSVSPDRGDGSRMSYVRFEDSLTGLDVFFDDVQQPAACTPSGCANFVETQIATGLSRTVPHTVKLTLDTLDGPGNDVVKVWIDNTLVKTGTSWEDYYRYDPEASAEQSPRIVKTVEFRESGAANLADSGKGFLIDNLSLLSGAIPQNLPTSKDQCMNNGWKSYGSTFKNQGDCVSFIATKGKNQPSGH